MYATLHPDFNGIPWVNELLSSPGTTVIPTEARTVKTNTEDSFFAQTLNTFETLRAFTVLRTSTETLTVISLGSGMNGHAGIAHGGALVTMLDEALGAAVGACFTVYLNTRFKKPVETPCVVLCRAKMTRSEGRKHWVEGTMENGMGLVMAEADALFIDASAVSKL